LYIRLDGGGPNGNYRHGQPGVDKEIDRRKLNEAKKFKYDF